MAEAHAAVAFSFSVTPDGELDVNFNRDVLRAVWESGIRSWRRRFERFKVSDVQKIMENNKTTSVGADHWSDVYAPPPPKTAHQTHSIP
jgi:carnitine O-palmitoyltransferase 1